MEIIREANQFPGRPRKVCLAIGVFDGVHLGHQQVLRQTLTDARQHAAAAVAVTFDRHPASVVAPERAPRLIYSLEQKLKVIESLGMDATLLIRFDHAFSRQSGSEFIHGLHRDFGLIRSVCVGSNFTFGHRRSGDVKLLQSLGQELKFIVHGLAAVALDGLVVSSTRIRESIRIGNLDSASQMLGRAYSVLARVVHGDQLGRRIGFPTANLDAAQLILPPHGVYAALAHVLGGSWKAVVNIGIRPTLQQAQPEVRVEAHLLDCQEDLYGQELELTFVERLRAERKFVSPAALQAQIQRDVETARQLLG